MMLRLAMILLLTTTAHGALYLSTTQYPDLSASYAMCQQYATDNSHTFSGVEDDSARPTGCYLTGNEVKWNKDYPSGNTYSVYAFNTVCDATYQCIQSDTHGIVAGTIVEKASNLTHPSVHPSNSMSYLDCVRYERQATGAFKSMGFALIEDFVLNDATSVDCHGAAMVPKFIQLVSWSNKAPGCVFKSSINEYYYNMDMASTASCSTSFKCIDGDAYVEPEQPSCPNGRTERCIKNEYLN